MRYGTSLPPTGSIVRSHHTTICRGPHQQRVLSGHITLLSIGDYTVGVRSMFSPNEPTPWVLGMVPRYLQQRVLSGHITLLSVGDCTVGVRSMFHPNEILWRLELGLCSTKSKFLTTEPTPYLWCEIVNADRNVMKSIYIHFRTQIERWSFFNRIICIFLARLMRW